MTATCISKRKRRIHSWRVNSTQSVAFEFYIPASPLATNCCRQQKKTTNISSDVNSHNAQIRMLRRTKRDRVRPLITHLFIYQNGGFIAVRSQQFIVIGQFIRNLNNSYIQFHTTSWTTAF